jgi:hypothetical protein
MLIFLVACNVGILVGIGLFFGAKWWLEKLGLVVVRKGADVANTAAAADGLSQAPLTLHRVSIHQALVYSFGSLVIGSLVALLVLDSREWIWIGLFAVVFSMVLFGLWLPAYARLEGAKGEWLDTVRRQDDRAQDEEELFYIDVGVESTKTGEAAVKRFYLGTSPTRAYQLATMIVTIWESHGKTWTPQALDEVAAAFRADAEELAMLAQKACSAEGQDFNIQVERRQPRLRQFG